MSILRRCSKLAILLLLLAQIGLVAHRIEHLVAPDQLDCHDDSCAAFAPATAPPVLVLAVQPLSWTDTQLVQWSVREAVAASPSETLGFRALAPPSATA